jgi:glycerol-3-phosphate dehydrogenase (NAD(P)+)
MSDAPEVAVLGGGSWGTILAHLAARNGKRTRLWLRDEAVARAIRERGENARYLPGTRLAAGLEATTSLEAALRGTRLVIFCVPSSATRALAADAGEFLTGDQVVLSATKGLEPESFHTMTQVLRQETCARKLGAISGPNLAKEILVGQPSATVVASRFREVIVTAARLLHQPEFRVYGNQDLLGVELAGALKNPVAIAAGVAHGLGYGHNVRALLVTRALAEVQRLGVKLGAEALTFSGLAGIGDMLVTCGSELSRNFRVGMGLAAGRPLPEILAGLGEVAEGVNTTRVALELARRQGVPLPIVEGVAALLFAGAAPRAVMTELMARAARWEIDWDYSAEVK